MSETSDPLQNALADAERVYKAAQEAVRAAEDSRETDRNAAVKRVDEAHAAAIQTAQEAQQAAYRAVCHAKIAVSEAKLAAMAERRVEEWRRTKTLGWLDRGPPKPTSRTGQWEVRKFDTELGGNADAPAIGELFIRINKRDGAPSMMFVSRWRTSDWRVVGSSETSPLTPPDNNIK